MSAIAVLIVLLAAPSAAAMPQWVPLGTTGAEVLKPLRFEHAPWVHTQSPSAHFRLPAESSGGTPVFPSLSVTLLSVEESNSVEAHLRELESNPHIRLLEIPQRLTIRGRRAAIVQYEGTLHVSLADGGGAKGQIFVRDIRIEGGGWIISCTLETAENPSDWQLAAHNSLCRSVRLPDAGP